MKCAVLTQYCVSGHWASVFLELIYLLLCSSSVYFHLRASFGSLCRSFTFYFHLILAVNLTAYPPSSNCFSTVVLVEELQLFDIQLLVQFVDGSRILNQTPSQFKHNVLCFSSAALWLNSVCVKNALVLYLCSSCLPPEWLRLCFCVTWHGQTPCDDFISSGPISNRSPNLPHHLSLALTLTQRGHTSLVDKKNANILFIYTELNYNLL